MKQTILCAAVWHTNFFLPIEQPKNIIFGCVFTGRRHSNCYEQMVVHNIPIKRGEVVDGFLTSDNLFLNREEAFLVAQSAGQLLSEVDLPGPLISEMIYQDDF